jgi:hypothetical protein
MMCEHSVLCTLMLLLVLFRLLCYVIYDAFLFQLAAAAAAVHSHCASCIMFQCTLSSA